MAIAEDLGGMGGVGADRCGPEQNLQYEMKTLSEMKLYQLRR
jgi:hypothetical protein